jgi:hypothetical protein
VADGHPEVVARLRDAYLAWWDNIASGFDEFARITIGGGAPDRVRLTSHDWHGENVPWHQRHVLKGEPWNGTWKLEVAEAGAYTFSMYRWPPHLDVSITGAVEGGTPLFIKEAQLLVDDYIDAAPVNLGDVVISFRVPLNAGPHDLNTIFIDDDGVERGAYFVVIEKP